MLRIVDRAGSGSWLRRFRYKLALPSVLMGLVVFSFTLLGFGSVVYTTALPSLIAVAEQDEEGAYTQIANGVEAALNGEAVIGGSGTGARSSVHASGATLGGIADISGTPSAGDGGDADAEQSTDEETAPPPTTDMGNLNEGGEPSQEPEPPVVTPDPAEEQAAYEHLLSEFQALEGYIGEANACVQAFNTDHQAPLGTRLAHQRVCDALYSELHGHYTAFLSYVMPQNSQYRAAYGNLVAMYRLLASYVGTISSAWTQNVVFGDDVAEHVDEYMAPIRAVEVNGENKYLTEFRSRYEGFVL